jgi:hypothetical protein
LSDEQRLPGLIDNDVTVPDGDYFCHIQRAGANPHDRAEQFYPTPVDHFRRHLQE